MTDNITAYVRDAASSFADSQIGDADLLAFSAILYAEFERFSGFPGSVRIADLPEYGTPLEYMEHDCNPGGMVPLLEAAIASPRFSDARLERFECIVDGERVIQFAAACYVVGERTVVIAFRGTDSKLVGWHEDFMATYLEAMPGQIEALRYVREAAAAYPDAELYLCGHSKGGSEAEFAAVFADEKLAHRIARAVSFDGPALFKNGGTAAPELEAFDMALLERYGALEVPLTRYVFPSGIGLMMERRDALGFPYTVSVDPARDHNVCSVKIEGGEIALREPERKAVGGMLGLTRLMPSFTADERRVLVEELMNAAGNADIGIDLSRRGIERLLGAVRAHYKTLPRERKRVFRKAFAKAALSR